jgi:uridine kinase
MRMTSQRKTYKRISESDGNSSVLPWTRVVEAIARKRGADVPNRAVLVGISGIDGSGKGFVAAKLANALRAESLNVAVISADDWLNLPNVHFNPQNYAEHFYKHAIRSDEMFERLIIPLRDHREIDILADCGDAKATIHRKHRYVFRNIDIVLLEGIFLFKPGYRGLFDLKIWVECSFQTALRRAIARGQEGLPPAETQYAFETIYFPAQRIHLDRDDPRRAADLILNNDDS